MRPYAIGAAFGFLLALALGWMLWHRAPVVEGEAIARELPGGALVLERDPAAAPPAEVREAAREAGGDLERAITITVQPRPVMPAPAPAVSGPSTPPEASTPAAPASGCECAPVTVDLGLIRMPDETRRVVATSRDGEIIGGLDIPFDAPPVARTTRWAAGLTVSVDMSQRRAFGAFVDRDVGRLRLGVELSQRDGGTATLRAGIRF